MENQIKSSIESITPSPDAEQRMYQSILQKAHEDKSKDKSKAAENKPFMKILKIALPAAACICLAVLGISRINFSDNPPVSSSSEGLAVEAANPFLEVSSAEDFKKIGIDIEAPEGAENTVYAIISGEIASISYDKDGDSYVFRASEQSGDFSGIYGEVISTEPLNSESGAVLTVQRGADADYLKVFWTDGKINYYLCSTGGGEIESFRENARRIIE